MSVKVRPDRLFDHPDPRNNSRPWSVVRAERRGAPGEGKDEAREPEHLEGGAGSHRRGLGAGGGEVGQQRVQLAQDFVVSTVECEHFEAGDCFG